MKKIIAFMLSFVLMFSFCACGNTETNKNEPVEAFTDIVVIDNEQCSFVITSAPYEDAIWGQLIDVRLENKTDKTLIFSMDEVSINGYMVSVLFATEVSPGKKENTSITIFDTELENNKIDIITDIEFITNIYDANDWMSPHIVNDLRFNTNFN